MYSCDIVTFKPTNFEYVKHTAVSDNIDILTFHTIFDKNVKSIVSPGVQQDLKINISNQPTECSLCGVVLMVKHNMMTEFKYSKKSNHH